MEREAEVLNASSLYLLPGYLLFQHLVHFLLHLLHVGIRTQSDKGTVAVVTHQVACAIVGVDTDGRQRHHDVDQTETAVLIKGFKHTADGHRLARCSHEREGLAHHIAADLLAQSSADKTLSCRTENLLHITLHYSCAEDIEETGVGKECVFKRIATAIFQRHLLFRKLIGVAGAHLDFRDIAAQGGNSSSRRILMFGRVGTFFGKCLPNGIYMILIHDATVVVTLQLHLGDQHQADGQSDSQ